MKKAIRKVSIVGVEGSGKTVMLAGLGELYSHPDGEGYFLSPKNFQTASYVSAQIARMRKGGWPGATAGDEMMGLDWTLRRRQGKGKKPKDVCEVSCLDFAGEVYRFAFGIHQEQVPLDLSDEVSKLKDYIGDADDLIVLVNLRDVIVHGDQNPRVQESKWITNAILSYALDGKDVRKAPRSAIVLSQADSYLETIKACGGAEGVLSKYLPHVANNYDWLDIMAVSVVDKTQTDNDGNVVPASDFKLDQLRLLMDWIREGFENGGGNKGMTVDTSDLIDAEEDLGEVGADGVSDAKEAAAGEKTEVAVKQASGLLYCFTFRGRKNRAQYWRFMFISLIVFSVCVGFCASGNEMLIPLVALVYIWLLICNTVRRLHDFNRSGWWFLGCWLCSSTFGIVGGPAGIWLGILPTIIIGLIKGTDGDNDYGPEP